MMSSRSITGPVTRSSVLLCPEMGGERWIAPPGFEPGSREPESRMIDHYTRGLLWNVMDFPWCIDHREVGPTPGGYCVYPVCGVAPDGAQVGLAR